MIRTQLYAEPAGHFVHELILQHDQVDFSPHGELAQELRKALIEVKHVLRQFINIKGD